MNLQLLSFLSPPLATIADVLLSSFGQAQKQYIMDNLQHMPSYLKTDDGKDALLLLLSGFADHVNMTK